MKHICILLFVALLCLSVSCGESREEKIERIKKETIAKLAEKKQMLKDSTINARINPETVKKLSPLFKHKKDEFTDKEWVSLKTVPEGVSNNKIYVYFQMEKGVTTGVFRFVLNYFNSDWLFIKSMIFNIDGENIPVVVEDVQSDVLYGGDIYERVDILVSNDVDNSISEDMIKKIANAKSVKIKLNGNQYYDTRTLSAKQIAGIKNTYDYFCALGGYID